MGHFRYDFQSLYLCRISYRKTISKFHERILRKMQKFKIVLYKVYKFADLNNFLNFPQLILLCVYFKFHGKDTGIGLIGAERCWKLPILAGIWTPNLEKRSKTWRKTFFAPGEARTHYPWVQKGSLYHWATENYNIMSSFL